MKRSTFVVALLFALTLTGCRGKVWSEQAANARRICASLPSEWGNGVKIGDVSGGEPDACSMNVFEMQRVFQLSNIRACRFGNLPAFRGEGVRPDGKQVIMIWFMNGTSRHHIELPREFAMKATFENL